MKHGLNLIKVKPKTLLNDLTFKNYNLNVILISFNLSQQGRGQDFSKGGGGGGGGGGSQRLLSKSSSGDRRLYMVYTAAFPRVSAGSVVLSLHEGPS